MENISPESEMLSTVVSRMRSKTGAFSLLVLLLVAVGCNRSHAPQRTIAIATLMSHPALDDVERGIKDELKQRGYEAGKNVHFVERNANGQLLLTASIADDLNAQRPDVIVAITTPMAQSVVRNAKCPVVFAAVTDPIGAKLVPGWTEPSPNITGTSDAWPYGEQLKLIREILPNAKRLGVLYNPGEAAAQYGIRHIRDLAPQQGFQLVEAAVSSPSDVYPVSADLVRRGVDALLLSSDNTVIAGVSGAVKVARDSKVPLFAGDSGTVEKGAIATVSVGYYQLGRKTGELVDRVLKGERNIPVVVAQGSDIVVNARAAQMFGVTIPPAVLNRAQHVYESIKQ